MEKETVARPDVLAYDRGYAKAVQDSQNIIGQRECFWQAQVKDEIKQARTEERKRVLDDIQAGAVSVADLIEAARQDTAREIFEEIEKTFGARRPDAIIIPKIGWQSLWDKWLKKGGN